MAGEYSKNVMSDALKDAIGERRVKTAVFISYQFDPEFFEHNILPLLFSCSFSHMPNVRLLQLEDKLRDMEDVAVYYDRHGLIGEAGSARLDYRRYEVSRRAGVFHAKNIFLVVENVDKNETVYDSLLVITTSANLTKNGWWENVEVVQISEMVAGKSSSLREGLITSDRRKGLLEQVMDHVPYSDSQPGLEAVKEFLYKNVESPAISSYGGITYPRIFCGREDFPEFIRSVINPSKISYNLEIISPFFEETDSAGTLTEMLEVVQPSAVRIFLPREADGTAACRQEYYEAVRGKKNVTWSSLPAAYVEWKNKNGNCRFVHAKVYRFFSKMQQKEFIVSGSVNLTGSAHSNNKSGNFESAILVDTSENRNFDWILQAGDPDSVAGFREQPSMEDDSSLFIHNVSLRFDWRDESLSYYWEDHDDNPAHAIFYFNEKQLMLDNIRYDAWYRIDTSSIEGFSGYIYASSIARMVDDRSREQFILIQEEGMVKKPSVLGNLTTSEILEYWSLISDEQKNRFIEERGYLLAGRFTLDGLALQQPVPGCSFTPDSLFDRFAGIFHAFSCLREDIEKALDENRIKSAEYRLFGKKYDSLGSLVERIKNETAEQGHDGDDPVNRYVILLCCRQLLDTVKKLDPDFTGIYKKDFRDLENEIKNMAGIRDSILLDSPPDEKEKFFSWFEQMFLNRFVPEVE